MKKKALFVTIIIIKKTEIFKSSNFGNFKTLCF